MNSTHVIYLLWDPRNGDIRYVGQTKRPARRLYCHQRAENKKGHCVNWERSLAHEGLSCAWAIVEDGLADDEANERERWWIAYGRSCGWPLTNLSDGGDGPWGYNPSPEHREKIGKANRGKRHSTEARERIRQGALGRWARASESERQASRYEDELFAALLPKSPVW